MKEIKRRFINDFKKYENFEEMQGVGGQEFEVFRGSRYRPKVHNKYNVETQK
jgi:hypothetical protein